MKDHVYSIPTVVIGSNLASLMFAYIQNATYIQNTIAAPYPFDYFAPTLNLEFLDISNTTAFITSHDGPQEVGLSRLEVWNKLLFKIALEGRVPFYGESVNIRIKNNTLVVVREGTTRFYLEFENLFLFDDEGIFGLSGTKTKTLETCKVVDWYDVNEGAIHPLDIIETGDEFVSKINFYPSQRIDGNAKECKDLASVSYMSADKLFDIEYSDLYSRLKTVHVLKENQIFGDKGSAPKITLNKRDVKYFYKMEYEVDHPHIEFLSVGEKEILDGQLYG